ncbi:9300_t:CDS:1, partial [Dentiscutata heterogama]
YEISNIRKDLEVRENEISNIRKDLEARDNEISNLRNGLETRDNEISNVRKDFEARDNEISNLRKDLEARDNEISSLHKDLEAKDNEILSLRKDIEARDNDISSLRKDLETKNDEISNVRKDLETKDKDLETRDNELSNLHKTIEDLKNEASRHQSALGRATNFRLSDDDCNNSVQLKEDITYLQKNIKDFCIVKPGIDINETEAKNLLQQYGCTKFTDEENFKSLLKAALQRCVLETILKLTHEYFQLTKNEGENINERLLETCIVFEANNLINKMKNFANFREGDDDVTKALPVKLRQQIYAVLGNRGFSKILSEDAEHPFINDIQQQLIEKMNSFRTVNDSGKATKLNSMVANIIRDVIRIFFFRLKVQEPEADPPRWFEHNDQVNSELMKGTFDQDSDCHDLVQICSFPLIGIDLDDEKKRKILIPAIVHTETRL